MKKLKNLERVVISIIVLIAMVLTIIPERNVLAFEEESTSAQTEAQLIEIINRLGEENIIFENAIGIEIGQEVNISNILAINEIIEPNTINLISNNENILTTVDNNSIVGINEGTTFLIVEVGEKYHVLEVYVAYPTEVPLEVSSTEKYINTTFMDTEYNGEDFIEVASGLKSLNPRNIVYTQTIGSNTGIGILSNLMSTKSFSYNMQTLSTTSSRSQYLVYVDAGHGGADPGAVANGVREKDINLAIALKVRDKLRALGVQVVMNRETDVFVNFKDTAAHANSVNPDAFVSIHNNSATAAANGIETYYNKSIDLSLANEVHSRLISYTGAYNRGVKWDEFYVTKYTTMPAILTETGFVTNAQEAAKLNTSSYQNSLANAITDGVMKYLKDNVKLSSIPAERISGPTRYETAQAVFNAGWQSADTIILVTGENYPDALCATPLAAKYDAPILLTKNTSLKNQEVLYNTIKSKGVKQVLIIGSEGIIPKSVERDLDEIGVRYRRIAGSTRYETSVAIANEIGVSNGEIIVAYGENFPDGLSIASIAAMKQIPILLTKSNEIPKSISNYIKSVNVNKTYLLGSEGLIPRSIANQLVNVERLAGSNRYETNERIFNRFKSELNINHIYIASALNFPDALSTSALAVKTKSFVLLSNTTQITPSVKSIIDGNRNSINKVYVLGSRGLIADNIFNSIGISNIK